jgi:single-strand DNA-binding protein
MSGALNLCQFIGNLGADPEARSFNNGGEVVNMRLACSESWKDKQSGEKRERTEWVSVAIFGPLCGVAKNYLRKGSKVYVCGKMQTRKWQDQSGTDRYTTEIVLQGPQAQLIMLGDKRDSGSGGGQQRDYGDDRGGGYASGGMSGTRPQPAAFDTDLDDDVPF